VRLWSLGFLWFFHYKPSRKATSFEIKIEFYLHLGIICVIVSQCTLYIVQVQYSSVVYIRLNFIPLKCFTVLLKHNNWFCKKTMYQILSTFTIMFNVIYLFYIYFRIHVDLLWSSRAIFPTRQYIAEQWKALLRNLFFFFLITNSPHRCCS